MRELAVTDDIDLAESFAYSDSITDLPMLEAVGHPVVVNPDRDLRRIALERGWEIRVFESTVALKTRRHVRPVAIGSGTVALAGAAAATWWYLRRGERHPPIRELALDFRTAGRVRKSSGGAELLRGNSQQPAERQEENQFLHRPRSVGSPGWPAWSRSRH